MGQCARLFRASFNWRTDRQTLIKVTGIIVGKQERDASMVSTSQKGIAVKIARLAVMLFALAATAMPMMLAAQSAGGADNLPKVPVRKPTPAEAQKAMDAVKFLDAHDDDAVCGGFRATHFMAPPDIHGLLMVTYDAEVWLRSEDGHSAGDCAGIGKDDNGKKKIAGVINLAFLDRITVRRAYNINWAIDFHCDSTYCNENARGTIVLRPDISEQQADSLANAWRALVRGFGAPLVDENEF
ncbi:MAG TPA: hypothetical protein DGA22_09305 [Acidobacterium sp.]|uniref:Uncharacterized protein n=2 Tax=Acidobacterium capsulatum TaxID=33075 RepID=C1F7C7_ACIC5|nr:hypothetical protein ACP_1683 [Acidobacterium capsulatum ATCC 51196]HCT61059.1 hypothetical protein [Acidobacterium sp.]